MSSTFARKNENDLIVTLSNREACLESRVTRIVLEQHKIMSSFKLNHYFNLNKQDSKHNTNRRLEKGPLSCFEKTLN